MPQPEAIAGMLPARITDSRDPGGIADLATADPRAAERLLELVGDARVVLIGEGAHNIAEFTGFADRLFRLLAREQGFTAFVKESGFAEGLLLDDWIGGDPTGDDAGELEQIASRGITYRFGESEPMRRQLDWMRRQSAAGTRLHYYGADLPGSATSPGAAVQVCLARTPARPGDEELLERCELGDRTTAARRLARMTDAERGALLEELSAVAERGAAAADPVARRSAAAIAAFLAELADDVAADSPYPRETFMADTVRWVLDREPKVLVSAHNAHVRRAPLHGRPTLGSMLGAELGDALRSIGMTFGSGPEFVWSARSDRPFDVEVSQRSRALLHGSLDAALQRGLERVVEAGVVAPDAVIAEPSRMPRERLVEVAGVQAGAELDPIDDPAASFDAVIHLAYATAVPGVVERLNAEFAWPEASGSSGATDAHASPREGTSR